ncbi:phenylacetic acid degradation operon negative regulatory protein PaaX [Alkalicoccus urumqiensis]|uniref:Phenylacetic acid degradation operon negative regulatory protein PaaX n=1 Tax=Alkalicoccus urumqiensis TaxID=1548213 RepID=A0A2P6ME32_ALKUR|nr:phenylacetic acid degradation operon negative regulatory protein PaaX [Alkalicoccus urumqiensis]
MNTRSMIFTIFGDYIRHYDNLIWIGSLISLLKEFGHNEQSVRAAISRMSKQGWIQAEKKGNRSFYSLTPRGRKRMDEAAERIYKLESPSWDNRWRMLVYSIPEEKRHLRDELRKELVWSGFGLLANSCWITPNPLEEQVQELVQKYDIASYVHFFEATYLQGGDSESLVEKCWDLQEINERYASFIEEYSQKYIINQSAIENGSMTDAECFVERTMLVHEYRKFLFVDPGLPKELLPSRWLGDSAARLFADYYRTLAEPAIRFFEQAFETKHTPVSGDGHDQVLKHPLLSSHS